MDMLKIIDDTGEKSAAEFNVYSEIFETDDGLNAKIILQPVNNANKNVKIYLDKAAVKIPITADNPIEIPIYYKKSENLFYFENTIYSEIIGLICYDLAIGEYDADPFAYESDVHDHKENYPYTYFNEICVIRLTADELIAIKNYHVVLALNKTDDVSVIELIKYEKVKPKLTAPKTIKGAYTESCFDCIELYDDIVGGVSNG